LILPFPPPLGGGASAAAYIEKLRAEAVRHANEGLVLVDAGDTWQGAPVGTLTEGAIMETYFDVLQYDAVVPGNHEFDKGKDIAIRMSRNMRHPFLCANIYRAGTQELVDWVHGDAPPEDLRRQFVDSTGQFRRDRAHAYPQPGVAYSAMLLRKPPTK